MKTGLYIFVLSLVLLSAAACSDDDGGINYGNFRYDMVTYKGNDNGRAVFALIPRESSEETELISDSEYATTLSYGQRVLLNYIPVGEPSAGIQTVTLRSFTKAITDSLRYTAKTEEIIMDSIRLKSIWRTGSYINLSSEVKYTGESRQIALVMDKATWHSDTVHCYLMHNMLNGQAYFWRKCYCSFYVGAVWNLASCKVIRVHVNDVIYPRTDYYDFSK